MKLNKDNLQASPMIVISDNESKQKQKWNVITQMASKNVGQMKKPTNKLNPAVAKKQIIDYVG